MQANQAQTAAARRNLHEAWVKVKIVELIEPSPVVPLPIVEVCVTRADSAILPTQSREFGFRHNDTIIVGEDLTMDTVEPDAIVGAVTLAVRRFAACAKDGTPGQRSFIVGLAAN